MGAVSMSGFQKILFFPPAYFILSIILLLFLKELYPIVPITSHTLLENSWFFALIGLGLIGAACWQLWLAKTTVSIFQQSSQLVSRGIFKRSRNPIYSGLALLLVALVIRLGDWSGLASLVFFVICIQFIVLPYEEAKLGAEFGEEFKNYKKKTRAWL